MIVHRNLILVRKQDKQKGIGWRSKETVKKNKNSQGAARKPKRRQQIIYWGAEW
jgi:hypothetical protein